MISKLKNTLKKEEGDLVGDSIFNEQHPIMTLDGWELNLTLDGQDQSEQYSESISISDNRVAISSPSHADLEPVVVKENTGRVSIYYTESAL